MIHTSLTAGVEAHCSCQVDTVQHVYETYQSIIEISVLYVRERKVLCSLWSLLCWTKYFGSIVRVRYPPDDFGQRQIAIVCATLHNKCTGAIEAAGGLKAVQLEALSNSQLCLVRVFPLERHTLV